MIIILTTIVAAAIPILSPSNDNRRLREASRSLNTYITGAQARAIALNRPFGIALKRLSQDTDTDGNPTNPHDDNGVCLEVFYIEQQPPYAGFDANSRACVALHPGTGLNQVGLALVRFVTRGSPSPNGVPTGWMADLFPTGMIRPGDVIEISGTRFELMLPTFQDSQYGVNLFPDTSSEGTGYYVPPQSSVAATALVRPLNDSGQQIDPTYDSKGNELGNNSKPPFWTRPAPYRILRQATPTSDEPYQLPEGTAIDLRASGVGINDYFYVPGMNDNSQGVLIMFAPEGRVSRVSYSQSPITSGELPNFDRPVVDNVYLSLGKRENIPAPAAATDPTLDSAKVAAATTPEQREDLREPINWLSGSSRWVVIGSQSGRIVTIENAFVEPSAVLNEPNPVILASQSTEEMRTRQILAAREFTREMAQLGGR